MLFDRYSRIYFLSRKLQLATHYLDVRPSKTASFTILDDEKI
jgi:hypothetical protein